MIRRLACTAVLLGATFAIAPRAQSPSGVDAAFARFFEARTPAEISAASEQVLAAGVSFDEAFKRLKRGRTYATTVARGIVPGR